MSFLSATALRHPAAVAILVLPPLLVLLVAVWPSLHEFWMNSEGYSHGYLVLLIAGWLAVRELRTSPVTVSPSTLGAIALLFVLAGLLVGHSADILLFQQLGVAALCVALPWAVAGWSTAKRFLIPAAYWIFAIPVWDAINAPLRSMTTTVVGVGTRLLSIPAFIEENTIYIPSGTFEVEGGCSGLRYLIVACALGSLLALLNHASWRARVLVVSAAAVLALLANWIRVFVIVVAGHLTEMQHYLVTVDHYYFGWVLFFLVMAPLFIVSRFCADSDDAVKRQPADGTIRLRRASAGAPQLVVTTVLLLGSAWAALAVKLKPQVIPTDRTKNLPAELEDWSLEGVWDGPGSPVFVNSYQSASGWYAKDDALVGVFVAHYPVQRQGFEVVYYANWPAGAGTRVVRRSKRSISVLDGSSFPVSELELTEQGSGNRLVWYSYQVAGRTTGDDGVAKLYQAAGAIRGEWDAQAVVLSAACGIDCATAGRVLTEFVEHHATRLLALAASESQ